MKRKITLSIALVLSVVLLTLTSFDRAAKAGGPQRHVANTGMITLGPNQLLRITAAVGQRSQIRHLTVTFNTQVSTQPACIGGVCKYTMASQTISDPMTLTPGEAASLDITQTPSSSGVSGEVLISTDGMPESRPDVEVNALIIDRDTGEVRANKLFVGGLSSDW